MGRRLRTHLDQLRPDLATKVYTRQQSQKNSHDRQNKEQTFNTNDPVFVKNYHRGPDWLPGEILTTGARNYKVKLSNGTVVRCHVDQMRHQSPGAPIQPTAGNDTDFDDFQPSAENGNPSELAESAEPSNSGSTSTLRRSTRNR